MAVKTTKKTVALLLCAIAFLVCVVGCGGDNGTNSSNDNKDNGNPGDGDNNNVTWINNCTYAGACKQVTIGTQTWMAENLNINVNNSWCYEGSRDSCAKYGRLYTWEAAKTACPNGWHLPSIDECRTLVNFVGNSASKLKSTSGWNSYISNDWENGNGGKSMSGNGTDNYKFFALPGGIRRTGGTFAGVGQSGNWWAADVGSDERRAFYWNMKNDDDRVFLISNGWQDDAYSVRCVRDK